MAGVKGLGVVRTQDPVHDAYQQGVLVAGPSRIPGLPGPSGEAAADVQGLGVVAAKSPRLSG
jgi:hypothetical protein